MVSACLTTVTKIFIDQFPSLETNGVNISDDWDFKIDYILGLEINGVIVFNNQDMN